MTKKLDTENGVEMTLIICHDSSILALLLALGVVDPADPRIPGFHTTLVIEVFVITVPDTQKPEDTEDAKYVKKRFIRFLLNNQPLKLGEDFQEWDPSGRGAGLHLYAQVGSLAGESLRALNAIMSLTINTERFLQH